MSTYYYPKLKKSKISFTKLKSLMKAKAKKKGSYIFYEKSPDENKEFFTIKDQDGNYLWVYKEKNNNVNFARFGGNDVEDIISELESYVGPIISEHEI